MFIPSKRYRETVEFANEDLRKFFCHDVQRSDYYCSIWHRTREEAAQLDPHFRSEAFSDNVATFTESFLTWLEKRKVQVLLPWIKQEYVTIERKSAAFEYMMLTKNWLEEFGPAGSIIIPQQRVSQSPVKTKRFAQFVARESISGEKWNLLFHAKGKNDDLQGFVSWLIVNQKDKTLNVVYDEEKVNSSTQDMNLAADRMQRVILHELGHARTHLNYLLEKKSPASLSVHEAEAWLYATIVRGLILGMKARICRLLDIPIDDEWR